MKFYKLHIITKLKSTGSCIKLAIIPTPHTPDTQGNHMTRHYYMLAINLFIANRPS